MSGGVNKLHLSGLVRGKTIKLVEEKLYIRKDQKELYEKMKGVKLERKERYEKQSLFE